MISYGPYMITNGLALLADAATTRSYSGTGSTWSDISNSNNDLTLTGSTTYNNPYPGGQSITTDGSTSYLSSFYVCNAPFTMSLTTKVLSFTSNYLIYTTAYGISSGFTIRITDSTHWTVTFYKTGGATQVVTITQDITSLPCSIDLVVSKTGSGSIYVNGVLRDSSLSGYINPATTSFAQSLVFGGRYSGTIFVASASANFYRISAYNRELTALEIQTNLNAMRGRYGI